jgi:YfiH family protein
MAERLQSRLLRDAGFEHAFFTRRGGVSQGPFASLNFSVGVGDEAALVAENFERAARTLGVSTAEMYFLSQVHGREARLADGSESARSFLETEGDIVLSATKGIACAVRTADCVPILLACRQSGAVAAVHAGWRGVVAGAVAAGVQALERLIGPRLDLIAAVGPHISAAAFEVSEEVAATLLKSSSAGDTVDRSRPKPHVDLRRIVGAQLLALGLAEAAVDHVEGCTFCDAERFFSFRRDGKRSGRHLSVIVAQ